MSRAHVEYWYGASFEVLGTRCVASMKEARKVVDLTPTIPIPGVKPWVRGLAYVLIFAAVALAVFQFLVGG